MNEVADKQPVRGKKKTTTFKDHDDHFVYDVCFKILTRVNLFFSANN